NVADESLCRLIADCKSAFQMWNVLKDKFEKPDPIGAATIRNRIAHLKFSDPKRVTEIMKKLEEEIAALELKVPSLSADEKFTLYLTALSEDFIPILSTVTAMKNQNMDTSLSSLK